MKFPLFIVSLVYITSCHAAGAGSTSNAAPVPDRVLLSAIADVESGNNSAKRGQFGERTRLQILPETWRQFSRVPHSAAAGNRAETDRVARAYLAVIRQRLQARGLPTTPFYMAAAWNAGPGWRRLTPATIAYAHRVANIVEESLAAEPVESPAPSRPAPPPIFFVAPANTSEAIAVTFPAPRPEASAALDIRIGTEPVAEVGATVPLAFSGGRIALPALDARGGFASMGSGSIPVIAVP